MIVAVPCPSLEQAAADIYKADLPAGDRPNWISQRRPAPAYRYCGDFIPTGHSHDATVPSTIRQFLG